MIVLCGISKVLLTEKMYGKDREVSESQNRPIDQKKSFFSNKFVLQHLTGKLFAKGR